MSYDLTGPVVTPEIGQQLLAEIADLNLEFIELLKKLSRHVEPTDRLLSLPGEQVMQLAELKPTAHRRLARSGVTLFDLRLSDRDYWQRVFDGESPTRYREHCLPVTKSALELVPELIEESVTEVRLYTLSALLSLRHIGSINRFIACLGFCVNEAFLDHYLQLPVARLRQVASLDTDLLQSRPHSTSNAWAELMRLARRTDGQPLLPARLLGYQHNID